MTHGNLVLTLVTEKERAAYVTREISVVNKKVGWVLHNCFFLLDTPPPKKKINIVDMSIKCVFLTGCLHLKQHNKYGQKYACIFIYNGDISNLTFELINMCSTTLLTIFHLYPYSQFIYRETLNPSGKNHTAATSHWQVDYPHNSI